MTAVVTETVTETEAAVDGVEMNATVVLYGGFRGVRDENGLDFVALVDFGSDCFVVESGPSETLWLREMR